MKTTHAWHVLRLVFVYLLVGSSPSSGSQGDIPKPRLKTDYYSRDNGVIGHDALEAMLRKSSLTSDEMEKLQRLIENSRPSRLGEIDESIKGFSKGEADSDSLLLLIDLKAELISERQMVYNVILKKIKEGKMDANCLDLARMFTIGGSDSELSDILSQIGKLAVYPDERTDQILLIIGTVINGGFVTPQNAQTRFASLIKILEELSRMKEEARFSDNFSSTAYRRDTSKLLLVKLGAEEGQRIVAQSISETTATNATVTSLSYAVPRALTYMAASPQKECLVNLNQIGENIRKTGHKKLQQGFFNNINILIKSLKTQGATDSVKIVLSFLQREKNKKNDEEWAALAKKTLERAMSKTSN